MKCALSKSPDDLARFWLDDLPEDEALALEEHAMDCAACYEGLRRLAEVGQTVRVVLATERLPPLPTPDQLIELRARLRLGIVHCAPGSTTTRPMERGTDGVVFVLHAELTGVDRIDVDICSPAGKSSLLLPDAPFDRNSGEVILACDRHTAQATSESLIRLLAGGGGRILAEYRLVHPAVESL